MLLRSLWGAGAGNAQLGQQMCRRQMVQCVAGAQAAKSPSPRVATKGFCLKWKGVGSEGELNR